MKKHFIFAITVISFVAILLIWISKSRLDDFHHYHTSIATESTASATSEISRFIAEKQHMVKVFGNDHAKLISQIAQSPNNEELNKQLKQRIQTYFPDYFSFTISRPDGDAYIDDFDDFIGELCKLDLKNFAITNRQSPRIHPNSVAYHFDVLTKLQHQSQELILFISFHADILGDIINSAQTSGHQLLLIDPEASNLIEVTNEGPRIKTYRPDYRLNKSESERILASKRIDNTRWNAIDLYETSLFTGYRNKIIISSALIFVLFVTITLIMMKIIHKNEKLRISAERHKDDFLSVVSHELRTPITSIYGTLSLIANEVPGKLTAQSKQLTQIALSNCEQLNLLINDLLDIQKIEAGKMDFNFEATDIYPFVLQCIENNHAYAEKLGSNFKLESPPAEIIVHIDRNRIAQVMANLLSNAAKYGGVNDIIIINIDKVDNCIRVSVTDHGDGIPESFRYQIFDKFTQSQMSNTRNTNGTGLGLCIARTIAEEHGGTIDYESTTGQGTTFYLDLPIPDTISYSAHQLTQSQQNSHHP
ncbi:MAG: HAMP domain-containing histidine kinase [Gammaproteobacteria bacterium]|nr:HAMP domain-containing histidine kinase [Gammaproteobacteria bacterium]